MPDSDPEARRVIEERLTKIDCVLEQIRTDYTRVLGMVEHHESILCGEGHDPGMKLRMDRMEQLEFSRKWVLRTAVTAVIAAIVAAVAAILAARPGP